VSGTSTSIQVLETSEHGTEKDEILSVAFNMTEQLNKTLQDILNGCPPSNQLDKNMRIIWDGMIAFCILL